MITKLYERFSFKRAPITTWYESEHRLLSCLDTSETFSKMWGRGGWLLQFPARALIKLRVIFFRDLAFVALTKTAQKWTVLQLLYIGFRCNQKPLQPNLQSRNDKKDQIMFRSVTVQWSYRRRLLQLCTSAAHSCKIGRKLCLCIASNRTLKSVVLDVRDLKLFLETGHTKNHRYI